MNLRKAQEETFRKLRENDISLRDVGDAISSNMKFSKTGHYLGPDKKEIKIEGKDGKTYKLRHGGGITYACGPSKNSNKCKDSKCAEKGFWGGVVGAAIALFFFGG